MRYEWSPPTVGPVVYRDAEIKFAKLRGLVQFELSVPDASVHAVDTGDTDAQPRYEADSESDHASASAPHAVAIHVARQLSIKPTNTAATTPTAASRFVLPAAVAAESAVQSDVYDTQSVQCGHQ